ncbi:MAG TPA: hypothetical protein VG457_12860 [Planctomycetota bacterium]|nr:hypothetical protein [Planctomycetota bacterium]
MGEDSASIGEDLKLDLDVHPTAPPAGIGSSLSGGGFVAFPPPFPLQNVRTSSTRSALHRGAADRLRRPHLGRQTGPIRLQDRTRGHGRRPALLGLPQHGIERRRFGIDRRHETVRRTPGH